VSTLRRAVVCTLLILEAAALSSQGADSPWVGTWNLDVRRSTVGAPLAGPPGFIIVSQTLTIQETPRDVRLSGETVDSDAQGRHTASDDNRINLDGAPTLVGPVSLRFKRLDGATGFEILSDVNSSDGRLEEVSEFVVSRDRQTLTETKTQSFRVGSPAARTSRSVLFFTRVTTSVQAVRSAGDAAGRSVQRRLAEAPPAS
jgi:hypothetical protein